jgi:phosphonate transport system permease protein
LIVFSWPALQGSEREISFWAQAYRLLKDFFPPDFSIWQEVLLSLIETVRIASLATLFAVLLSVPMAVMAFANLSGKFLSFFANSFLILFRTIPSLIWAVIAVALMGPTPRAGVLALTFYSVGYLGKFFKEIFEQEDPRPLLWMRANHLSHLQIVKYFLWPTLQTSLKAKSLWMWEYNIRSASIIGYVGAGGLGLQLHTYQEYAQWNRFSFVLCTIFVIVAGLELVAFAIRKRNKLVR